MHLSNQDVRDRANLLILGTTAGLEGRSFSEFALRKGGYCDSPAPKVVALSFCAPWLNFSGWEKDDERPFWASDKGMKDIGIDRFFGFCPRYMKGRFLYEAHLFMPAQSVEDAMKKLDKLENASADGSGTSPLDRVQYSILDLYRRMDIDKFTPKFHPAMTQVIREWSKGAEPQRNPAYYDERDELYRQQAAIPAHQAWTQLREKVCGKLLQRDAFAYLRAPQEGEKETAMLMQAEIVRYFPLLKDDVMGPDLPAWKREPAQAALTK